MSARRPLVAYWTGEEPTGPGHSPTLADIPAYLVDSMDLIIINYVLVDANGDLDFKVVEKHNDQQTIMNWIAGIRARQKTLPNKTKFSLGIESSAFHQQDPAKFAAKVSAAAKSWGMDGIDIDYEPPSDSRDILQVVEAIKEALPTVLLSTPIYFKWLENDDLKALLRSYAALFNYVTTMDYTPYPDYQLSMDLLAQYASVIGGTDPYSKLVIGVSCTDLSGANRQNNFTPLGDVKKFCDFQSENGTRPGMMLYSLSYDTPNHAGGHYPFGLFTYTNMLTANLRPA